MIIMQKREKMEGDVKFTDYAVPDVVGFLLEKLGDFLLVSVYGDTARQFLLKSMSETEQKEQSTPAQPQKIAPPSIKLALDDFKTD